MRWAQRAGLLPVASSCSICGAEQRLQFHSENYYDPLHPHAVCGSCHMKLHRRFRSPTPWLRLVERYANDESWFAELHLTPIDLAAALVAEHGEAVTHLLATVMRQLPAHVGWPRGRLVTITDFLRV